ncbi:sensor domain-containing diguanylate cyclase [Brumicola nitratireducens]|uniref:diguanylate cyclase n=1 Tax=Glaciecola nitratireducens (strain JCM 12485 / KCTC 12276 / FR1064) TaxID=1085623 RepID=G4QJ85_GLANF|nr:diguanylate cyclase [Glaciecola nitratireducens]AEP28953.1 diguanylate cyclase [Glaciecola nitratireducens FR1064]
MIRHLEKDFDIKKLLAHTPQHTESVFSTAVLVYGLNFGGLGALTNYFLSIPFYGHFSLYFGQIFVLICLITRGLNAGIIASVISATALAVKMDDPFLFIILVSETFAVHIFLRKGKVLLVADVFYWLFIGVPLTLLLLLLTSNSSTELLIISGLTISINGIFGASVAALIYSFIPFQSVYRKYRGKPPKFATIIFSLCMLTVTLPTIAISLVFTWQTTAQKEQDLSNMLSKQGEQIMYVGEAFVNNHISAVKTLSSILSESSFSIPVQTVLDSTAKNYPSFTSMLVSGPDGEILYASPEKYAMMLGRTKKHTLHTRTYFNDAKRTLEPQLSEAIEGVGFGNDAILTVSAPIVLNDQFLGISQGAIRLSSFSKFKQEHIDDNEFYQYVITDRNNRIIFASDGLSLPMLSQFSYQPSNNILLRKIPELKLQNNKYLYYQTVTEHGWKITVLNSPSAVTQVISQNFYILAVGLLITLVVFSFIASQLSKRITLPLERLANHFNDTTFPEDIAKEAEISDEMIKVTDKLINSREIMLNFQQQLTEQVQDKTKQLKSLNQKLYHLAQKDGLTNLLNRSGFDDLAQTTFRNCVRNYVPLSMVLIDIDDFKQINDTYGHPFGDKCIVSIAQTLSKFCKRNTDLLGRYGGEEFIVLLSGGHIEEHHELTKQIHRAVQKTTVSNSEITVKMTISIGISSLSSNYGMTYEGLVKSADEQLYKSKRTGKNKISIYVQ